MAAGCAPPGCGSRGADGRLNIVLILSDALRAASVSLYGYPRSTTPHLEALAREGVVFDHHLVHYPGTSVSVSQLHTGRLVPPLLVSYKYIAVPVRALPPDLLVLPDALRRAGFLTGLVSSHYWFTEDTELLRHFDHRAVLPATGDRSYALFEELWPAVTRFLDEARRQRRPFFLYLHTLDTHGPYEFHPGFDAYRNAGDWPEAYNRYDSEIAYTDHWIGRILDDLRERRLLDRTLVIVTSDHGEQFHEMGPEPWHAHHGPVVPRALVHVPLLARIPDDPAPGRRYVALTRHIDLAPTLLRLAAPAADLGVWRVDGDDLSGELRRGGTGEGVTRTSIAFSPRYWGVYTPTLELHYDQWTDTVSPLFRVVPDAFNYPRLVEADEPATRSSLETAVRGAFLERTREYLDLPENPDLPQPALISALLPVKPGTLSAPRFEDLPDDNRWANNSAALQVHPGERPAPLTLTTPWVTGTYRVSVVLYGPAIRERGYQNVFTLHFPGGGNTPVRLRGADADTDAILDAGTQRLGRSMDIELRDPEGGVAITGFRFERVGGPPPTPSPDAAVRERLRALGYLHD